MKLIPLWYGDNLEFCDGNLIPGVTSLCPFSASDLPLCASHTWLHLTESEVSHHAAACHRAASQTRQCDVGSLITWSYPYLPVPVYILFLLYSTLPQRSDCFSVVYSSQFCFVFFIDCSCISQTKIDKLSRILIISGQMLVMNDNRYDQLPVKPFPICHCFYWIE